MIEYLEGLVSDVIEGEMTIHDAAGKLFQSEYFTIHRYDEMVREYNAKLKSYNEYNEHVKRRIDEVSNLIEDANNKYAYYKYYESMYVNYKIQRLLKPLDKLYMDIRECLLIASAYAYTCIEGALILKYSPYRKIMHWKRVVQGNNKHPEFDLPIDEKELIEYLQPLDINIKDINNIVNSISGDTYDYTSLRCIGFYDYMDEHNIHSEWDKQMYSQLNYFDACRNAEINAVTDAIRTKGTLTGRFL